MTIVRRVLVLMLVGALLGMVVCTLVARSFPGTSSRPAPAIHLDSYPGADVGVATSHSWASTLITTPFGSRTKKRRTPQGSSTGP